MSERKKELRAQLRENYQHMSAFERNAIDTGLIHRFMGHDLYKNCERIFLYASVGTEIDTLRLLHEAWLQGKTVALPKCFSSGIMEFYEYNGSLKEGKYHIPEPAGENMVFPQDNDLMIVPGLAFDRNGYRIGQGGGYYDRYLAKYNCIRVGFCRERFLLKEVPIMWNDIPVDYVITENAVINCKNNGASEEAPLL